MLQVAQKMRRMVGIGIVATFILGVCALSYGDAKDADLIKVLGNENRGWRYSSAQILGNRGVKEAVGPLIDRLKVEKDPSVRIVIVQALHKIGAPQAIEALKEMANTDTNPTVRHIAAIIALDMEKLAFQPGDEQTDRR